MDGAVMVAGAAASRSTGVGAPQLPLAFVSVGHTATVMKVRGGGELHHHLENLGFVEGAQVMVVCENAGNIIVEIKGAQVALDRQVAMKVVTSANAA